MTPHIDQIMNVQLAIVALMERARRDSKKVQTRIALVLVAR